jgi:D-aspartate ligase
VSRLAVVLGRIDLVRALGRAGIRSVVVGDRDDPIRYSRFVTDVIGEEALWERGERSSDPLPLFYDSDRALQFISRNRSRLAERYRFVLPEEGLLDELLDKGRFQALAERAGLPVPPSRPVRGSEPIDLRFPLVVKASPYRDSRWERAGLSSKVLRVDDAAELGAALAQLEGFELDLIAQELIPGPEHRVESHHVYVDDRGEVAGEFTGRKIRTAPREHGISTALETTDAPDVLAAGRDVVERLGLRGVAKLDFKRGPDGRLHLLEVNPRFTLWTHVGALAGVNLPAIVHADLTGRPRPPARRARAGVRWIWPRADAAAAREEGISRAAWLAWALRAEVKGSFVLSDPGPYLVGRVRGR